MTRQELDQLLDHDYDGIQEFDNPLPGWWVNLFWATCIFSVAYYLFFHLGEGPSIQDQYAAAQLRQMEKQAELYKDLEISNASIFGMMSDANLMNATGQLFAAKCASCHLKDGGGNIGPNLTDEFYLHGNEPMDSFGVITNGVAGKGMQAWETLLSPVQRMWLAAYVGTLRGTTPAKAKAPQGVRKDPFVLPESPTPAEPTDTAKPEDTEGGR